MFCNGPKTASIHLNFPKVDDEIELFRALCNITNAIEKGLENESILGKAVSEISNSVSRKLVFKYFQLV